MDHYGHLEYLVLGSRKKITENTPFPPIMFKSVNPFTVPLNYNNNDNQ